MDMVVEPGHTGSQRKRGFGKKIVFTLFFIAFCLFLLTARVQWKYAKNIIDSKEIETPNIALVFGAGLKATGGPSDILEDRIRSAIALYQEGKVGKIILSGDNRVSDYNEVEAMKNFALEQGLPEEALLLDGGGVSTYDSCRRLQSEFNLSKAVLVTQRYHLFRALYVCRELGIDAVGVAAIDRGYFQQKKFSLREWPASLQAWWQVNF